MAEEAGRPDKGVYLPRRNVMVTASRTTSPDSPGIPAGQV